MEIPQEVLDKYRYFNTEFDDWWAYTYDYWKNRLERMGVDVDEINFSGFWSQGDGASFTGTIRAKNLKRFMRIHGMRERYRAIYTVLDHLDGWVTISRSSSHYCHEYTVTSDACIEDPSWIDYDTEDIREALVLELYNESMLYWQDFGKEVEETLRGYMQDIYRALEKDHEDLTSDEAVREAIIANELYDPAELTNQE